MKKVGIYLIGIVHLTTLAHADEVSRVGTTAAQFLGIDVGSRAVAMGSAFVSVADDASAMYYNPAGIAWVSDRQVTFTHMNWIADVSINYIAAVFPLGNWGTVGFNAKFVNAIDNMEVTTVLAPEGTGGRFSATSNALGLGYAKSLTDRFSFGLKVKYVHEKIYHESAKGLAFDVGTLFTTQFNDLKIGMSISNYGSKMQMDGIDLTIKSDVSPDDEIIGTGITGNNDAVPARLQTEQWDLPLLFRVGISMDVLKGMAGSNLILAADALHPSDDLESVNVGCEYLYKRLIALRAGYRSLFLKDTEQGLTLGAGILYNVAGASLRVDYAYMDFGLFNNAQMYTVQIDF